MEIVGSMRHKIANCDSFHFPANYFSPRMLVLFLNKYAAISGKTQFSSTDWRFNEFPNPAVYALYMTCVELMALPSPHTEVANHILNVVTVG